MLTDLFAGARIDRTATRWGRFRPYILFGAVPLMALLVALFTIPSGLSDSGKVIFGVRLLRAVLARLQLRQHPLRLARGGDDPGPDERAKISTVRIIAASLTILLIAVVVSPQIEGAE